MTKKSSRKRQGKSFEVEVKSSVEADASGSLETLEPEVITTSELDLSNLIDIEEPEVEQKEEKEQEEVKEEEHKQVERYFKCPFCLLEGKELSGRDPINTWCLRCGKCFIVTWLER